MRIFLVKNKKHSRDRGMRRMVKETNPQDGYYMNYYAHSNIILCPLNDN